MPPSPSFNFSVVSLPPRFIIIEPNIYHAFIDNNFKMRWITIFARIPSIGGRQPKSSTRALKLTKLLHTYKLMTWFHIEKVASDDSSGKVKKLSSVRQDCFSRVLRWERNLNRLPTYYTQGPGVETITGMKFTACPPKLKE